ncbi:unnamed protein product [Ectocarpus fasciculatus]
MALVDTQGFVMAVDRSLFGPQGRRWIERKLPNVATNIAFVAVSAFGACVLVFHITREYYKSGYWAILQTPKHILNAVVLHLVARALRWHIDRMLGINFAAGDEALPDFFGSTALNGEGGGGGPDNNSNNNSNKGGSNSNSKPAVLWPWQTVATRWKSLPQTRSSTAGGGGDSNRRGNNHRRSRSADMTSAETAAAAAAGEAAIQEDDDDDEGGGGGGGDSLGRSTSSLSLPESARLGWEQGRRSRRGSSSRQDGDGFAGSDKERGEDAAGAVEDDDDGHGRGGRENHQHTFPDLFGACRPSHHDRHRRRERSLSSPPSSPSATLEPTRPSSVGRNRNRNRGRERQPPPPRRRLSLEVPRTAADRWVDEGGNYGAGEEQRRAAGAGGAARQSGCTSDDGGAGGHGAGSRGSRRRLRRLTGNSNNASSSPQVGASAAAGAAEGMEAGGEHVEEKEGGGRKGAKASVAAAVVAATASATGLSGSGRDASGSGGGGSSRRWRSIDKLSRALGSTRRRTSRQGGAARGEGGEGSDQQKMNFFTEKDLDELLHSTFFIKMCDDASWLYVEDHPFQPELNWLLSLWGGFKITPRFQGEVKQNEAHRMLFQAENGRHRGHVRIRSRATNTFLFFLGIKQPLTWVAWDRDVVGGEWEDLKLEWVGKPQGPDGVLVGDERGRVVIRSRPMRGYVSWNGSRFTHVPGREGATVFMLQRMAPSSSSSSSGATRSSSSSSRRTRRGGGDGRGGGGSRGGGGGYSEAR